MTFKQSCSRGDGIARHHCVQFSAPNNITVLRIDRMRGPVQFNGLAVSCRAQSVVTMELRELIAKTHIVDLLDSPRGQTITTGFFPREKVLVDYDNIETLFGQPVRGSSTCGPSANDQDIVVGSHSNKVVLIALQCRDGFWVVSILLVTVEVTSTRY